MRRLALLLAAFAFVAPAKAGDEGPLAAINTRFAEDYLNPAVSSFKQNTQVLAATLNETCQQAAVQTALQKAVESWGRLAVVHLPITQDQNRNLRVMFHPDPRGTGQKQLRKLLNSKTPVTDVRGKSIGLRGLTTLDRLVNRLDEDRACTLAKAVATDLQDTAQELADALPAYLVRLENPNAENPLYRTHAEAASKTLQSIGTSAAAMRDLVIVPTLGENAQKSRWKAAPMRRSGLTLAYLDAQLAGLEALLATVDATPEVAEARDATAFEIANLRRQLQAIDMPLEELATTETGRTKLIALRYGLDGLERAANTRLMASFGLQSGFNALDGD